MAMVSATETQQMSLNVQPTLRTRTESCALLVQLRAMEHKDAQYIFNRFLVLTNVSVVVRVVVGLSQVVCAR